MHWKTGSCIPTSFTRPLLNWFSWYRESRFLMSLLLWNRYKQAAFCFEELILSQPTNALYHLGYAEVSALIFLLCSHGFFEATNFVPIIGCRFPDFCFMWVSWCGCSCCIQWEVWTTCGQLGSIMQLQLRWVGDRTCGHCLGFAW